MIVFFVWYVGRICLCDGCEEVLKYEDGVSILVYVNRLPVLQVEGCFEVWCFAAWQMSWAERGTFPLRNPRCWTVIQAQSSVLVPSLLHLPRRGPKYDFPRRAVWNSLTILQWGILIFLG